MLLFTAASGFWGLTRWRKDLTDQPLPDAEVTWFTDGSSFLMDGQRKARAVVVDREQIIWAEALLPGTSAQKAELIALTQALNLGKDRKINICSDSRYAFAMAHVPVPYTNKEDF